MNRVLLLIDDYSELTFVQIILKKIGFDVDSIQHHRSLPDKTLSFRPQLIILNESSKKNPMEEVIKTGRSLVPDMRFVILGPKVQGIENIGDGVLKISSPVQPVELIKAAGQSCQIPSEGLIEKFKKFRGQLGLTKEQERSLELSEENETVLVEKDDTKMDQIEVGDSSSRTQEYESYLEQNRTSVKQTFSAEDVHKSLKSFRQGADDATGEIDQERKSFVDELFKHVKGSRR